MLLVSSRLSSFPGQRTFFVARRRPTSHTSLVLVVSYWDIDGLSLRTFLLLDSSRSFVHSFVHSFIHSKSTSRGCWSVVEWVGGWLAKPHKIHYSGGMSDVCHSNVARMGLYLLRGVSVHSLCPLCFESGHSFGQSCGRDLFNEKSHNIHGGRE